MPAAAGCVLMTLMKKKLFDPRSLLTLLVSLNIGVVVGFTLTPDAARADSITLVSERTETFPAGSPDQPRIIFQELKKKVDLTGLPKNQSNYLTDTRFFYDAETPDRIEDFAIVQWIKGCMFHSKAQNGKVTRSRSISRNHFGQNVPFQHRDWEIDSDSADPIYTNYETFGRHALLRWIKDPKSLDAETTKYYGQEKPTHGAVFATDLPGTGFLIMGSGKGEGEAQNASLEFRTCLFKKIDLPTSTTKSGANIDASRAIRCVAWSHQFVWNFAKGRMTEPKVIDPFCEAP